MNGIVTGKQEKQAGSLVWKTALVGSIPTQATALMYFYVPDVSYLSSPYFLKLESTFNRIAYISMNFISENTIYDSSLDPPSADYIRFERNDSDPGIRLAVGDSDNFKIRDNLVSVEIGTFE